MDASSKACRSLKHVYVPSDARAQLVSHVASLCGCSDDGREPLKETHFVEKLVLGINAATMKQWMRILMAAELDKREARQLVDGALRPCLNLLDFGDAATLMKEALQWLADLLQNEPSSRAKTRTRQVVTSLPGLGQTPLFAHSLRT